MDNTINDSTKKGWDNSSKVDKPSEVSASTSHSPSNRHELSSSSHKRSNSNSVTMTGKDKPRVKRPYIKRRLKESGDIVEKPPPKKRGRKSKKELQLSNKRIDLPISPKKISKPKKSSLQLQKNVKKVSVPRPKRPPTVNQGPSVFDKKILAGPHLTMKQVLEYILTDHSYCIPPDPLPAVGSNHQMIRYILGPKNGAKPQPPKLLGVIEPGDRSPLSYSGLSRTRGQLNLPSTPPLSSKLEHLLKRGDISPSGLSVNPHSSLRVSHLKAPYEGRDESDIEIDVDTIDAEPERRVIYNVQKAKEVMNECEKYVEFARNSDTGDDWELKVVKTGWTKAQTGLYDKVIGTLHTERLARLAYDHIGDTEPVLRRASIDRTASRIRRIFGEHLWDSKLTQWLHGVLIESLNYAYLAMYLDVLQTLKAHCPQLINRMTTLSVSMPLQQQATHRNRLTNLLTPFLESVKDVEVSKGGEAPEAEEKEESDVPKTVEESSDAIPVPQEKPCDVEEIEPSILLPERTVVPQMKDVMGKLHVAKHAEAVKALLGRQWDPYAPVLHRMKKLSSDPVFLLIAPCAIFPKTSLNRRLKQFYDMFRRIGKIVTVSSRSPEVLDSSSASSYIERLLFLAKEKMKQIRNFFPDRPLYLVGWGSGSILAARLSNSNAGGPVEGIVALGFPLLSLGGMNEDLLKVFSGIKHPVLFVIGGLTSNNSLTDMELFRRRLACETSLVIVGSGNENLYVSRAHREKLFVTQSFVDKVIMDEIAYFVNLHSKHNQMSATIANISMKPSYHKSQSTDGTTRKNNTSRPRKRSSSTAGVDVENSIYEDSKNLTDDCDRGQEGSTTPHTIASIKREPDSPSPLGSYDYDFDGPKFIPSNKSSNKRKAYYRPDPSSVSSPSSSSSCITASKLVQQSPNAKRRMSKPSGPTTRVPLLGQQPNQRSNAPPATDVTKDDPTGLFKYLSSPTTQNLDASAALSGSLPLMLRQPQAESAYHSGASDTSLLGSSYYGKDGASAGVTAKPAKKKSSTKSKAPRNTKGSATESPASALASAITDPTSGTNKASSTPPSSLDMHKFVLQHQQMIKQLEHHRQDRPQTSHLFKLLSPGDSESLSSASLSSAVSQGSEIVKLKLIGSQPVTSDLVVDARNTTLISKQSLVSNMSLPMIKLARPEDNPPTPVIVTGPPSSSFISNVSQETGDRFFVRAAEKGLLKLNASDLKQLIGGGRGIQVVSSVSGITGQTSTNIFVKRSSEADITTPSIPTTVTPSEVLPITPIPATAPLPDLSPSPMDVSVPLIPADSEEQKAAGIDRPELPVQKVVSEDKVPENDKPTDVPASNVVGPAIDQREGNSSTQEENLVSNPSCDEAGATSAPTDSVVQHQEPSPVKDPPTESSDLMVPLEVVPKEGVSDELSTEDSESLDAEEEMSGLKISSTFSVCPLSGERVMPENPEVQGPNTETASTSETDLPDTPDTPEQSGKSKKPLRRSARLKSGL